jgi:hypothetical protein
VVNGLQHVRPGAPVTPQHVPMATDNKGVAQVEVAHIKTAMN